MSLAVHDSFDATSSSFAAWDPLRSFLEPVWIEVSFLFFFVLGFFVLRFDVVLPKKQKGIVAGCSGISSSAFDQRLQKAVQAEAKHSLILSLWRQGQGRVPTPVDVLRPVMQAMLQECPEKMVSEMLAHIDKHAVALANPRTVSIVLEVVARAGEIEAMKEFADKFRNELEVPPSLHSYEVLLGGHATAGDEQSVEVLVRELESCRFRISARGFSLMIKGFLKNGMVDAVVRKIKEMSEVGFQVPSFAVTQLFRIACEQKRCREVFDKVVRSVPLCVEVVSCIIEDCCKHDDGELVKRVEQRAREDGITLSVNAYDSLLKLNVAHSDLHVFDLFSEMQDSGLPISEGLCVGLLARCAEVKFLRFAEEVHRFCRSRGKMTIAVYSALMKVYAFCGMYDKACGLYDKIIDDGLEPDSLMYGCLMKFAVECGRTDLSSALAERAPSLDIHNYMSLIRAAGRDRDVARALKVLDRMRASGVNADVAAHNCALDACVSAGDTVRARQLFDTMRADSKVDIVSYNTLLKGATCKGDIRGAHAIIREMRDAGLRPNDVSYNCLINAAVSWGNGDLCEAWRTIDDMEQDGIAADRFTVSTMFKALRLVTDSRDVHKTMAWFDRSGLDASSDEVLLNHVIETCLRHRLFPRLEGILASFRSSDMKPSVHTYSTLIKASSTLHRLPKCREYWHEMQTQRGMQPDEIALGCMLDALVTNGEVDSAVQMLGEWKDRVPPNQIMYSTIMKGLAKTRQAPRALATWREMRKAGIKMNTVMYNAVIDAQASVGAMGAVSELVAAMESDGVTLDAFSLSTIAKGYCVKGDLDKAFEVFRDMQMKSMAQNAVVYNTLIDGCSRHCRFDLADIVIREMEDHGVSPSNFTVGILVKMYGKRKQLDKAIDVFDTIPAKYGFSPNAQAKTSLIWACLNNNGIDRAFEVFNQLREGRQQADAKAWGAMISGCVRHGRLEDAVRLLEEAVGIDDRQPGLPAGSSLEAGTIEKVLSSLSGRGLNTRVAQPLVRKLRHAGYKLDSHAAGARA